MFHNCYVNKKSYKRTSSQQ